MDQLPALAKVFSYLSLLTIGGGMAAYPELQNLTVNVHHWLTSEQLIHIYSVGQMAPGPNMMMVAAVGEQVSGIPGALIAALAFFVPTGFLTFGVGRLWTKLEHWPWRASIQKGSRPSRSALPLPVRFPSEKVPLRTGSRCSSCSQSSAQR